MGKVAIGVTGHRVLAEPAKLVGAVDSALRIMKSTYPESTWDVVSSLAEGADRLLAVRAMEVLKARLVVVLPLKEEEYAKDFHTPVSLQEFQCLVGKAADIVRIPAKATTEEAYEAAGLDVLNRSNLLLVVWDGEEEQGRGGTARIVAEARARGKAVLWIHAGNREPGGNAPTTLGAEQGSLTIERLDAPFAPVKADARNAERRDAEPQDVEPRTVEPRTAEPRDAELRNAGTPSQRATRTQPDDIELERIETALERRDSQALEFQARRWNFARLALILGPLAVFFLILETVALPNGGPYARGLIALELLSVMAALAFGFLEVGQSHHRWIRSRLRAELLRRECFMLKTRVGAYDDLSGSSLCARVSERLLQLDDPMSDPIAVLSLDPSGNDRDDRPVTAAKTATETLPALAASMEGYLNERIRSQRSWFMEKGEKHAGHARVFENGARLILTAALVVAAIHLGLLRGEPREDWIRRVLVIVAIMAPAIGSAFVGLQSVTGSHRLSRSYAVQAQKLESQEVRLGRLIEACSHTGPTPEIEGEFKKVVGATETILSEDLLVWWMIMSTEAPRAGV